jgi:hypothetical protein
VLFTTKENNRQIGKKGGKPEIGFGLVTQKEFSYFL